MLSTRTQEPATTSISTAQITDLSAALQPYATDTDVAAVIAVAQTKLPAPITDPPETVDGQTVRDVSVPVQLNGQAHVKDKFVLDASAVVKVGASLPGGNKLLQLNAAGNPSFVDPVTNHVTLDTTQVNGIGGAITGIKEFSNTVMFSKASGSALAAARAALICRSGRAKGGR